jgi:hypothetical protein
MKWRSALAAVATLVAIVALAALSAATSAAAGPGEAAGGGVTIRYWVAGCSVAEDLWRHRKSSTIFCDERGRTLESAHGVMAWPEYVMASEIDTLIVKGIGLEPLRFRLEWSTDDTFAPERSVQQVETVKDGEVRFVLAGAPEWRGLIRRFRLTWTGDAPHDSRILAAWGRRELTPHKPTG